MTERFRRTDANSFFGPFIYDRVIPADHFLRRLRDLIDWEAITEGFVDAYKGGAEYGPPPYPPSVIVRMLVLSRLYNLSERQTEETVNFNMAAKFFVGLEVDQAAPDHSTLSVFKRRLSENWQTAGAFEELFKQTVRLARAKGIKFGQLQVVDSTHSVANVDVSEDEKRQKRGKGPRDPEARWGAKGKVRVKRADGEVETRTKYFYGYKQHISLNAQTGIVTSAVHMSGAAADGKQLEELVRKDEEVGVEAEIYAGDKGYDDGDNHEMLESKGKKSALRLNRYRTQKKDKNKEKWVKMVASAEYELGQKERYKVEQKIAEGKRYHGLGRCQYVGKVRYAIQGFLTLIVLNAKRLVKLLTGTTFRGGRQRALALR
jgi:IS5 family transposase